MTAKGQIKLAHVEVGDQERQSQIRARVGVKFDGDASFFFWSKSRITTFTSQMLNIRFWNDRIEFHIISNWLIYVLLSHHLDIMIYTHSTCFLL